MWLMSIGESKYTNPKNNGKSAFPKEFDRPNPEGNVASFAFEHLRYTAKFGDQLESVLDDDGKYHFSYKDEYETWLQFGAPGIFLDELESYLVYEPL